MKKYVNKAGNVVIIEQEKDGFSPMYENYTFLNYFTWEDNFPPLQDSEFESIEEWFNFVSKYDFSELKKAYFENNKADEIGFYELLCEKLSEEDIFALPIMKVKGATYPYAIVNSPCTLEGNMVGIAWDKKESISERLGVEIVELSNATKTILEKVALDLKLQNLYLNGEVYQFTLYKDDSLKEELMNIGELINYDSDEELFEAVLSHISDKVEDLDFERVYEPAVISKEYVERYINNDGDTLLLVNDEYPLNPMEDWDMLMNYYTWENRYISMQKGANQFSDEEDWYDSVMGEGAYLRQAKKSKENNRSVVGFAYDLCANLDKKGIYALPILKYEHSLVRYYIGDSVDRWDGGVVGFAWRDKKELCKEYGVKKLSQKLKAETIEKVVESELRAYTNFANGEAYGFELYSRENGEDPIDSCYGFIGYDSTDELFKDVLEYIPSSHKEFFKVD
jgi:hypothetical protein